MTDVGEPGMTEVVEDEMCQPGGLPWDEASAFPLLADYECGACGLIGNHEPGCPNGMTYDQEVTVYEPAAARAARCKTEGHEDREAAARKGPYAFLCEECVTAKKAANGNGVSPLHLVESLLLVDAPATFDPKAALAATVVQIEAAIKVAVAEFETSLRKQLVLALVD